MSEIIADTKPHNVGEREVVNWTRPDGVTYFDVPIVYLREASADEYLSRFPHVELAPERCFFWEVSVD
jgi:hypothetical protein